MKYQTIDRVAERQSIAATSRKQQKESFMGIGAVRIRPFVMEGGNRIYLDVIEKNNLIVQKGRNTLLQLLLGNTQASLKYIRWGKGGAPKFPDGDPLVPFTVSDTDTDVASFLIDKPLNTPITLSPTDIQFTETIICDEVNDDVNEAAILFEDPTTKERSIFARITFPTLRLTIEQGTGIELSWSFHFNAAQSTSS